ncbi:hypothetical protein [Burkholderia gladioli]|uniref:hypothetical protein n=1 Tax=Burkholderia gladioli TaxID=28095 RepID=UPI001642114D|nr:hypothetical protein [Burkholderia gladioli]
MAKQSFDPKKPHPFVADYWTFGDDAEHSTVRTHEIGSVSRAADAIRTLSRIVHNSLSETSMSGGGLEHFDGLAIELKDSLLTLLDDLASDVANLAALAVEVESGRRTSAEVQNS